MAGFGVASSAVATVGVAAFAAFAAASAKAALEFDQSFTRIAAISNTSTGAIEGMKTEVLALAGETAQAPTELADALFFLASAGLDANEVMPALEASAKASAVGLGETADIANIVASALNAYSKSGLTAAQATDVLVAAVREGRAEPEEFAIALGRILPIASTVGVTFDQVAASMAALSNIGLDVTEGVTAMRGVLQAIAAPGSQAAEAMDALGLSAQTLLDAISEDGIIGALRMLDSAAKKQTDTQAEYNAVLRKIVPNVRALTGVFGLTVQEGKKVDAIFQAVLHSQGALNDAFKITTDSAAFRLQKALNDIAIVGQKFATAVLPAIADALTNVATILIVITGQVNDFDAAMRRNIITAGEWELNIAAALESVLGRIPFIKQGVEVVHALSDAWASTRDAGEAAGATADQLDTIVAAMQAGDPTLEAYRQHFIGIADSFLGVSAKTGAMAGGVEGVAGALTGLLPFLAPTADGLNRVARGHQHAADAARDQRSAELALISPLLAVLDSADQLQASQAEVNRLRAHGKRGTEEYRDAVRGEAEAYVRVQNDLLAYGESLTTAGKKHADVVRALTKMGKEAGLTKGDIRGLINELDDIPDSVTTKILADKKQAEATIVSLENRLNTLVAHDWELRIHATTTGGSTAFDLIDHLTDALETLVTTEWDVEIHALGKAQIDQLKAYRKDLDGLQRQYEKLKDRADAFRDSIRSGFADFADLTGGMIDLLGEFAQAQATFAEATAAGTLEAGATAPVPPDLSAFLAGQLASAQEFADALKALQDAGLSQANLAEVAASGSIELAEALLSDPALIAQMNATQKQIAEIVGDTAKAMTDAAFGEKFQRLEGQVSRLIDHLRRFIDAIPLPELKDETREFISAIRRLRHVIDQAAGGGGGGGGGSGSGGDGTPNTPVHTEGTMVGSLTLTPDSRAYIAAIARQEIAAQLAFEKSKARVT